MNDLFRPVVPGLTLAQINEKNRKLWGPTKDAPDKETKERLKELRDELTKAHKELQFAIKYGSSDDIKDSKEEVVRIQKEIKKLT